MAPRFAPVLEEALQQRADSEAFLSILSPGERLKFERNLAEIQREVEDSDSWEPMLRRLRERLAK